MTKHTCHFPHCPPNWCPLCGSCAACREVWAPPLDTPRDPPADALVRLSASFARVAARLGVRVEADEWVVAGTEPYFAARKDGAT